VFSHSQDGVYLPWVSLFETGDKHQSRRMKNEQTLIVLNDRSGDRGQQQLAIQNHKIFKNNIPTTHWKSFKIDGYP